MKQEESAQLRRQQHADDIQAVARDRSKQAFSRLFDHFAPLIRTFCLSASPAATLQADDITQEVMLKVWQKASYYRHEYGAVSTWIFTMARNTRIDYLRKNGRHVSDIDPSLLWEQIPDDKPGPFWEAQQKRHCELITSCLEELPTEQKQVLIKAFMEGLTHAEISRELGISLGTVKSRIRLALKKLSINLPSQII